MSYFHRGMDEYERGEKRERLTPAPVFECAHSDGRRHAEGAEKSVRRGRARQTRRGRGYPDGAPNARVLMSGESDISFGLLTQV